MQIGPGDVVHFAFDEVLGGWHIYSRHQLVAELWANNTAPTDDDAATLVRLGRVRDELVEADAQDRIDAQSSETWDEEVQTQRLLSELGLT